MNYEKICDDIFNLDSKIRFVAVHDDHLQKIAGGMRNGLNSYLPNEITTLSIDRSFQRWNTRKEMSPWLGNPVYAFTEYDKIKRFTFYLNSRNMLIISTEKDIDDDRLVKYVLKQIEKS